MILDISFGKLVLHLCPDLRLGSSWLIIKGELILLTLELRILDIELTLFLFDGERNFVVGVVTPLDCDVILVLFAELIDFLLGLFALSTLIVKLDIKLIY